MHFEILMPAHHYCTGPWEYDHHPSFKHSPANGDGVGVVMCSRSTDNTSLLVTSFCHLIPMILARHLKWNICSLCSRVDWVVVDSL